MIETIFLLIFLLFQHYEIEITIQNPAIPKTRKRALVTNSLAYSKTLYFTDTKRFSTLSKSKSPNQAR